MGTLVEQFRFSRQPHYSAKWKYHQKRDSGYSKFTISSVTDTSRSKAPILTLPVELIQHVVRFLEPVAAASFSLSSRVLYYAVGSRYLNDHLSVHTEIEKQSRAERRKKVEILERAFSSHWYCAWCERFHAHETDGGPSRFDRETKRDCVEYNSYLHDEEDYVLCYHHIHLAMNRHLWGPEYGIPLSAFSHSAHFKRTIGSWMHKMSVTTHLQCEARIVAGHFILHTTYTLNFPPSLPLPKYLMFWSSRKAVTDLLTPDLPHIVTGHRDSHNSHTGMSKLLFERLKSTSLDDPVRTCNECATDFSILSLVEETGNSAVQRTIWIEVWRDLGTGRNPFDSLWRAHGAPGKGNAGFKGRIGQVDAGSIKKAFEEGQDVSKDKGNLNDVPRSCNVDKPKHTVADELIRAKVAIEMRCKELRQDIHRLRQSSK